MFFLRGRRRKKLLQMPLSTTQRETLHRTAPLCVAVPAALQSRLEGVVQVLLAEKRFEGAGGLELTEEMTLAIAGQAAILQLRASAELYPDLDTVLVYPDSFVVPHQEYDDAGHVVHEGPDERAGESWQRGVVVLNWRDVARESRERDGFNLVLHEFAHQLDELDGEADGTPPLPRALLERWPEVFQAAFARHQRDLRRRRPVLYDENAAESPCEFFATTVELFFEYPRDLRREFGDVYALVAEYLEVDPAGWDWPQSRGR
jgi:hypothetical protein